MANAKINYAEGTRQVLKTELVKVPDTVTLELTLDEARAIRTVFRSVGGGPTETKRGVIAAIDKTLRDAGVGHYDSEAVTGGVYFTLKSLQAAVVNEDLEAPKLREGARIRAIWDGSNYITGDVGTILRIENDQCHFVQWDGRKAPSYAWETNFEVIS